MDHTGHILHILVLYLAASTVAMKEICKARYEAFGSAGQAGKIKPISLDNMAIRYAKGELKAIIK